MNKHISTLSPQEELQIEQRLSPNWKSHIESILERNGIIWAAVFGSILRSDYKDSSDLDLLVLFPDSFTYFDVARVQRELTEELGITVDLASWNAVVNDRNPLRKNVIFTDARNFYDKAS